MKEHILNEAKKLIDQYAPQMTKRAIPLIHKEVNAAFSQTGKDIFNELKPIAKAVGVGFLLIGAFTTNDTIQKEELLQRAINITYNEVHIVNNYKGGN